MGDRANILIKSEGEQVCLYSHHGGTELPDTLRAAMLRGKERLTDPQYLARIIFCEMVRGREMDSTGFGISQTIHDGGDRVIVLDVDAQTVMIGKRAMGFDEFISRGAQWS